MTDRRKREKVLDGKKTSQGAIAQLGERLPCTQEVVGSIPSGSTNYIRKLLHTINVLMRDIVILVR